MVLSTEVAVSVDLRSRLTELTTPVTQLEEGLLVSATYDGDKGVAVLKFYDPTRDIVVLWEDNSGHRPYCYTKLPRKDVERAVAGRSDILDVRDETRMDLLSDKEVPVLKIIADNPLAIGGNPGKSLRDFLECWEADIKYFENYVYDKGLKVGTYYRIRDGKLEPVVKEAVGDVKRSLDAIVARTTGDATYYIRSWAELLGQPLTGFKRISCDIEVANEEGRIPDPEVAERPVIAVSFHNDKESLVYLVERPGVDNSLPGSLTAYDFTVFPDEASMLRAVFAKMMEYPFLITFNGDDFDLRYLKHRAMRKEIGIIEEEIPIALQRQEASLKHGVHIDLYRFFNNRSVQLYVYGNRYSEHTLNGISEALLNKSKMEFDGNIAELPLLRLADYCFNDSQITYMLTSANDSLLMKVILVISRIAKMPMNDVARLGVSNWIRSMLYYDHRRVGALIPRADELKLKGGASSEAIIKGKKYKGGLVIEPKPGIYFGVSVLDFASLYPSIIKVHNLSYETVNCGHEECRTNRVPDTSHWVCRKRSGIESLVIGSLRDLRVGHYKSLAKDKSLPVQSQDLYRTVTQGLKVILNACFTPDTCIVTPSGIKNIRDVRVGEEVVNVNPDTLAVEVDKVIEVQQFSYTGELLHFRDERFVDLMVTPNHRFLVGDHRSGSKNGVAFRTAEEILSLTNMTIPRTRRGIDTPRGPRMSLLTTAKELGAYADILPPEREMLFNFFGRLGPGLRRKVRTKGRVREGPSRKNAGQRSACRIDSEELSEDDVEEIEREGGRVFVGVERSPPIPVRFDSRDVASFCGWFASSGSLFSTSEQVHKVDSYIGSSGSLSVAQDDGKGDAFGLGYQRGAASLLSRLDLAFAFDSGDRNYLRVSNRIVHRWLLDNCYTPDAGPHRAIFKRIPGFVFQSKELMTSFLEAFRRGGPVDRRRKYSTASFKLAEDIVVLLSLLGERTRMQYDEGVGTYTVLSGNCISRLTRSGKDIHRTVRTVPFDGTVHCVTTARNHTVMAGRDGRFVPVGQSYGVMGFETFALYCLPVAEATAALGRDAITRTIAKCKQEGVSVIYSDTDSLFIENPETSKVSQVLRWAEKELGVELEVDKTYRYVAFSERKKNYFGVLQDGTADIKGLTGKKSQTPPYLKNRFYEMLSILGSVRTQGDFDQAKENIKRLLNNMVVSLKERKVPLEELSFNVMMGKSISGYRSVKGTDQVRRSETKQGMLLSGEAPESRVQDGGSMSGLPQHVKAAMLMKNAESEVKAGAIISFVKTRGGHGVKPTAQAKPEDIDVDKYIEYASSMFDQVLSALDLSFDSVVPKVSLDSFWS